MSVLLPGQAQIWRIHRPVFGSGVRPTYQYSLSTTCRVFLVEALGEKLQSFWVKNSSFAPEVGTDRGGKPKRSARLVSLRVLTYIQLSVYGDGTNLKSVGSI